MLCPTMPSPTEPQLPGTIAINHEEIQTMSEL